MTKQEICNGHLPRAMLIDMDDTIIALTETSTRCWGDICMTYAPRLPAPVTPELVELLHDIRTNFWRDPANHRPYRLDLHGSRRVMLPIS